MKPTFSKSFGGIKSLAILRENIHGFLLLQASGAFAYCSFVLIIVIIVSELINKLLGCVDFLQFSSCL